MPPSNKYLLRRIYALIKSEDPTLLFKKNPWLDGTVREGWYNGDFLCLNIKSDDNLIAILLHEYIHCIYNKWSEKKVERKEKSLYKYLSVRQTKNLYKLLVEMM
ncbi:hypothetical protein ACFLQL_00785 [Verrucomicrobiota bacterium]